jgi:hypothetical protein
MIGNMKYIFLTYLEIQMLFCFSINLVKLKLDWFIKKRFTFHLELELLNSFFNTPPSQNKSPSRISRSQPILILTIFIENSITDINIFNIYFVKVWIVWLLEIWDGDLFWDGGSRLHDTFAKRLHQGYEKR